MTSSVGMMKFPPEWKNKFHVPKHQKWITLDNWWHQAVTDVQMAARARVMSFSMSFSAEVGNQ